VRRRTNESSPRNGAPQVSCRSLSALGACSWSAAAADDAVSFFAGRRFHARACLPAHKSSASSLFSCSSLCTCTRPRRSRASTSLDDDDDEVTSRAELTSVPLPPRSRHLAYRSLVRFLALALTGEHRLSLISLRRSHSLTCPSRNSHPPLAPRPPRSASHLTTTSSPLSNHGRRLLCCTSSSFSPAQCPERRADPAARTQIASVFSGPSTSPRSPPLPLASPVSQTATRRARLGVGRSCESTRRAASCRRTLKLTSSPPPSQLSAAASWPSSAPSAPSSTPSSVCVPSLLLERGPTSRRRRSSSSGAALRTALTPFSTHAGHHLGLRGHLLVPRRRLLLPLRQPQARRSLVHPRRAPEPPPLLLPSSLCLYSSRPRSCLILLAPFPRNTLAIPLPPRPRAVMPSCSPHLVVACGRSWRERARAHFESLSALDETLCSF